MIFYMPIQIGRTEYTLINCCIHIYILLFVILKALIKHNVLFYSYICLISVTDK